MLRLPGASDEWSLAYDRGTVDHQTLYHGLDGVTRSLGTADVVVVGNSRAAVGFHHAEVAPFFADRGLDYYNLAVGQYEGFGFPLAVMERHETKPALVVVNADRFFGHALSPVARAVLSESRFQAVKHVSEKNLSWRVRRAVHAWFPLHSVSAASRWVIFRHRAAGSWWLDTVEPRFTTFVEPLSSVPPPDQLEHARRFLGEVEAMGAELMITRVPSPQTSIEEVERLAEQLAVTALVPRLQGLRTLDESHLDPESAARFTRAFLDLLVGTEVFQRVERDRGSGTSNTPRVESRRFGTDRGSTGGARG